MIEEPGTIVVNATALDGSGALTVLRQFLAAVPENDRIEWIVFISPDIEIESPRATVRLVPVKGVKPMIQRLKWDMFGVRRWLRREGIKPAAAISLQNTGFRTGYNIPNYIYYHQSITLTPYRWSLFKKSERKLWFYKNVYPIVIRLFLNRRTRIFVQLEYIKERFARKFRISSNRIYVISPLIHLPVANDIPPMDLPQDTINLFYPATAFSYKNHSVVIDALNRIKSRKFVLWLTVPEGTFAFAGERVREVGVLSFDKMVSMYAAVDAVVFPSYIETYGLPLLEAAALGVPVIAADLPYAREVLDGYAGGTVVEYSNADEWAAAIGKISKKRRFPPFEPERKASWDRLFAIITHKC